MGEQLHWILELQSIFAFSFVFICTLPIDFSVYHPPHHAGHEPGRRQGKAHCSLVDACLQSISVLIFDGRIFAGIYESNANLSAFNPQFFVWDFIDCVFWLPSDVWNFLSTLRA
jgi:hypothetical protein